MAVPFKLTVVATVFGLASIGAEAFAADRVSVEQATTAFKLVYVRQAMELPDQRAARAAAVRAQRTKRAQRTQAKVKTQRSQASDASMLKLSPVDVPLLPAAHIAVQ